MFRAMIFSALFFSRTVMAGSETTVSRTPASDPLACLKVLNESSITLRGKIFPLNNEGSEFMYKTSDGHKHIVTEERVFDLTEKPTTCHTDKSTGLVPELQDLYAKEMAAQKQLDDATPHVPKKMNDVQMKCGSLSSGGMPYSGGMGAGTGILSPYGNPRLGWPNSFQPGIQDTQGTGASGQK